MTRRERIAQQRVLAQEALGKLRAIEELFGAEDAAPSDEGFSELDVWRGRIDHFEEWIWHESPIA